jgi:histidinol phosphatase-like PHP family hydrolase
MTAGESEVTHLMTYITNSMKTRSLFFTTLILISVVLPAQRRVLNVPGLPGLITMKCDFHSHTDFSDGNVWPTTRVGEAWRDGLDVIAITDHIEYQPHKAYIPIDYNAAWKIAKPVADNYNIILVHGAEITRSMPPGHLNALFITDADSLKKQDFMKVIEAAIGQGAFIQWNHPGWKSQQPDGIPRMYPVHNELIARGWLHGIEYYNDNEYYPLVMDMCRDNNLALTGNSDIHGVISEEFSSREYSHRPMTLVFARERTAESLREALFAGRTAVWYGDRLAAFEEYAAPLFKSVVSAGAPFKDDGKTIWFEVTNTSDIPMKLSGGPEGAPSALTIPATGMAVVKADRKFLNEPIVYNADNIITGSSTVLKVEIQPAGQVK